MRHTLALAVLIGCAAAGAARADVYRWVDEQGRVHYSDRWVPGSELIKTARTRAATESGSQASSDQNRLAVSNDRIAAQLSQAAAARAVQADVAKARTQQCEEAKARYEQSIQARRIYRTGKDGEREYLSDAEADEWRLQARTEMLSACGEGTR